MSNLENDRIAEQRKEAMDEIPKPQKLKDKHLIYLDALRESGTTNMFGAKPYLQKSFRGLSNEDAGAILTYWMKTFSMRHPR